MSSSVLVYNGPGAHDLCVRSMTRDLSNALDSSTHVVKTFNHYETSGLDQGNVAAVVLPGGNAMGMVGPIQILADKLNCLVVKGQTAFLGFGAGAIVCAENREAKGKLTEQGFPLNFHPFYSNQYLFDSCIGMPVKSNSSTFKAYYYCDPAFPLECIPEETRFQYRPLLMFDSDGTLRKAENSAAAILYNPPGKAPRIVAGVHLPIGGEEVRSEDFIREYGDMSALANQLDESEQIRKEIFRSWCSELGLHLQGQRRLP